MFTRNPLGLFVYAILSQWYLIIATAGLLVAYWVLKGLNDIGALEAIKEIVVGALEQTKAVAKYCVPKIMNINDFWDCLQNLPDYQPSPEEESLNNEINNIQFKPDSDNQIKDPYLP